MRLQMQLLVTGAAIVFATTAYAGDPTPPVGPVTGTMKTLDEVEPRTAVNDLNTPGTAQWTYAITQPGSYYLTGPVHGAAGKQGIAIDADNVTLDLNGFSVNGDAAIGVGIRVLNTHDSIEIKNGTVRTWQSIGIFASGATGSVYSDLRLTGNGSNGLSTGYNATVRNCVANSNGANGFFLYNGTQIVQSTAVSNGLSGFAGGTGNSASNCVAQFNDADGFVLGNNTQLSHCSSYDSGGDGISVGTASTVANCDIFKAGRIPANGTRGISTAAVCVVDSCTVREAVGHGISVDATTVISRSTATLSGANGINTTIDCVVTDSVASVSAGTGIVLGDQSRAQGCISNRNAIGVFGGAFTSCVNLTVTDNTGDGISLGNDATIRDCEVQNNGGHGMTLATEALVVGCNVSSNVNDGIRVSSAGRITENQVVGNGISTMNAGIRMLGADNLVQANSVIGNYRGVTEAAGDNMVIQNVARGNTFSFTLPFSDYMTHGDSSAAGPWDNLQY